MDDTDAPLPSPEKASRDSDGAMDSADTGVGRFLTLADTAELLNISVSQAYSLVRSNELPAIKVGGHGHWRVERDVLESYIAAKYEESRRRGLWNQSDYASLAEYSFDSPRADSPRTDSFHSD